MSLSKAFQSRPARIVSWVLTGLVGLFMAMDCGIKLAKIPQVTESFHRLGYSGDISLGLGLTELAIMILYLTPRTAVLGAILMTALLGGAITSHLRVGDPWPSHILFGVYIGVMAWGGLFLRDPRLRDIMPFRSADA
ncbi:DoxX family protein [Phenylobacterium sp. LH3H17]|uniref:DoxX family protein n=1 Tax=Phenylobacterium sp. LH3H17 TaxID=2903901 RepID=UPI0020C98678|nr:DoxX family protein [Phenylobacterium sp. LH3H17]UTP40153.1 DoxX family protein [Phenylobacterium sp. LH3H17]